MIHFNSHVNSIIPPFASSLFRERHAMQTASPGIYRAFYPPLSLASSGPRCLPTPLQALPIFVLQRYPASFLFPFCRTKCFRAGTKTRPLELSSPTRTLLQAAEGVISPFGLRCPILSCRKNTRQRNPSRASHAPYFETAALRTCVLKKPPLVFSITCW